MAHDSQALRLAPGDWDGRADHWIGQALQHASTEDIRHQVEHQGARLFYALAGSQCVGAFVLRIDQGPELEEGVIVAAAGHLPGADMIATCLPAIESLFADCARIRYHTARPALARRLASLGYQAREIVCMKEIKT